MCCYVLRFVESSGIFPNDRCLQATTGMSNVCTLRVGVMWCRPATYRVSVNCSCSHLTAAAINLSFNLNRGHLPVLLVSCSSWWSVYLQSIPPVGSHQRCLTGPFVSPGNPYHGDQLVPAAIGCFSVCRIITTPPPSGEHCQEWC